MAITKKNYLMNDITIVLLSPSHKKIIRDFECQIKDLNDFIKDDALKQQEESVNSTYLWISKKSNRLLAYITLCTDSIHLAGRKKEEMKKIGISYKSLSALKICRMAVHKDFIKQSLGTNLLAFAIKIALEINKFAGCRFLTLEAKNTPDLPEQRKPIHFYKKNDFEILKERKETAAYVPMFKDLKPIINETKN